MTTTRKVPREALWIASAGGLSMPNDWTLGQPQQPIPVRMLARTGQPLEHWYWGRVVHDMAGMRLHKQRLTIDYMHDGRDTLGYLDRFDIENGDLVVSGALTPLSDDDLAMGIYRKSQMGVPYEASIYFSDPLRLEEVPSGREVEVNGRRLVGPLLIIREWSLRNVAICPHGYDRNTRTEFAEPNDITLSIVMENAMSTDAKTDMVPENQPSDRERLKQYMSEFGAEQGAEWFAEGLDIEACTQLQAEHVRSERDQLKAERETDQATITELTAERDQLTAERDALKQQATDLTAECERLRQAIPEGEPDPLNTGRSEGTQLSDNQKRLGPNLGAFADSIKLPGK